MPLASGTLNNVLTGCGIPQDVTPRTTVSRVSDNVIQIFQDGIDTLIAELGKNIELIYDPSIIDCPHCIIDPIGNKPSNRFRPGNPIHYPDGRRCPYCNGVGKTEEKNSEILKVLIQLRPRDYRRFGISVQDPSALVRTKGFMTDIIKIQRAKEAIMDVQVNDILKIKCRKLRDPIPTGLRESRYAICFWERI